MHAPRAARVLVGATASLPAPNSPLPPGASRERSPTIIFAIRLYMRELVSQYTRLLAYQPSAEPRAVMFQCHPSNECRKCTRPGEGPPELRRESVCGMRCGFRLRARRQGGAPGEELFDTLHEAGEAHAARARAAAEVRH